MGWVTVNGIPRFYEDSPHTCSECEAVIPTHHEQCRKHYFEHINANKKAETEAFWENNRRERDQQSFEANTRKAVTRDHF